MSFSSLGLSAELCRAVAEKGYAEPTPVQRQAIPVILEGRDVLAGAQTGTGKTAGFTLPLLQRLSSNPADRVSRAPRVLVLTPTRELAAQVGESVATYGKYLSLRSAVIFGGVGINPQIDALRRGVDVLVATPGRLLDHVGQNTLDLSRVEVLVLDEADRMLDMGFIRDIRKILALLPKSRQNLLFSATFADEIKRLADDLLVEPALIEVARRNAPTELVTQVVHPVDRERKRELLSSLISTHDWKQVLVFTRTKHGANRLAQQLERDGITAAAIHGNKSQGARTRALAEFKQGKVRVLVATDIAARGLDIDQLPHVVNYELPNVPEDYVHRIGRTGRAGNEGEAASLVCVDENKLLRDIERVLGREIAKVVVPGFEPDPSIRPEPIANGRNSRDNGRQQGRRAPQPQRQQGQRRSARPAAPRRDTNPGRDVVRTDAGEVDGNRAGVETHANRPVFPSQPNRSRNGGRRQQPQQSRQSRQQPSRSRDQSGRSGQKSEADGNRRRGKDDVCALLGG